MRDQPDPIALLTIVAETLHADVIPNLSGSSLPGAHCSQPGSDRYARDAAWS